MRLRVVLPLLLACAAPLSAQRSSRDSVRARAWPSRTPTRVMLDGDRVYSLSKKGTNAAVFAPTGALARAGWVFDGNTERLLRGSAFLIHEQLGSGNVVCFVNEPMFRGWWSSLDHLVLNAILLGPARY